MALWKREERAEPMSSETEFAAALSEALGPMYRITVVSADGVAEAIFGDTPSDRTAGTEIRLPRSSRRLVLEMDGGIAEAARRVLAAMASLAPRGSHAQAPAGSFTHVDRAMEELIALAEAQIGHPLSEMSRAEKQQVVRFLDERGAFALRKSAETVADALGVSRFTVYNYLDASRQS